MATDSTRRWESLEQWRSTMFLVAGPLVIVAMRRESVAQITDLPEPVFWSLLPLGFALALLGLLGFHAELTGESPRLARLGRAFGLIVGLAILLGVGVLAVLRPHGPYPANLGPIGLLFLLGFQAFIVTAVAIGTAAWRTGTPSRSVGGLLLALGIVQLAEQVFALGLVPGFGLFPQAIFLYQFGLYGAPMVAGMLAVGALLRGAGVRKPAGAPDQPA